MQRTYEQERLEALHALEVLDSPPETEFDAIVAGARHIFDCAFAFVSMIDADRQWFKAKCGIDADETPRDISFCNRVIHADEMLVIPDAQRDPRFADSPFVTGMPFLRFYTGVPIRVRTRAGARLPVGTLCVADTRPHDPSAEQLELLRNLARVVETLLETRQAGRENLELAMARHEALFDMQRTQRLLQHAERMAQIGSWRLDRATGQVHWSDQTYSIHGLERGQEKLLAHALEHYPPADRARVEAALNVCLTEGRSWDLELDFVTVDGQPRRVRTLGESEVRDGRPIAVIGVIQDITERHQLERRLRTYAQTDELTGVASRRAFNERLEHAIADARDQPALAVAILDLDRFKEVNDRLGHLAGDEVLKRIGARLYGLDYLGDGLVARLGGDEFVVLLHGAHAQRLLPETIERLLGDLRLPVPADDGEILVSATIGACSHTPGQDRAALLKAADEALYRAKRWQRGTGAIAGRMPILTAREAAGTMRGAA